MIKYIKKIFNKEVIEQSQNDDFFQNNLLALSIDKNNKPVITVNVKRLQEDDAIRFAEMLFLLNNGLYQLQIVDMLKDLSNQDHSRKEFILKVLEFLSYYIEYYKKETINSENKPCISPMSFSKIVNQSGK